MRYSPCRVASGLAALNALIFSGSGLPVAGSGSRACRKPKNCSGDLATKTGAEISTSSAGPPLVSKLTASARGAPLALSDIFEFGPAIEKRISVGVFAAWNRSALEMAFASGAAANEPTAHTPF